MKYTKVVSRDNLPKQLPLWQTIIMYLFLDKMKPPSWVYGAIGCLYLILWVVGIILVVKQKQVDIFEDKNNKP